MSKQTQPPKIDIVDIKAAVKYGSISFCVSDGYIYCDDIDSGEVVLVGKVEGNKED